MGIEAHALDACPGGTPYARTTVTSSERLEIPAEMIGRFCWFQAVTSDVAIRFGGDSIDVALDARSSVSSEALTAEGSEPHVLVAADTKEQWRIPADATHMAHISADTDGVFRFGLAEGAFGAES